jgi:hypothetical protein
MDDKNSTGYLTSGGAPIVADSFEVRYNSNDDLITDQLFKCISAEATDANKIIEFTDAINNTVPDRLKSETIIDNSTGIKHKQWTITNPGQNPIIFDMKNRNTSRELLLALMSNWEDAVSWVWSTCLDCSIDFDGVLYEIPSMGQYEKIDLAEAKYEPNKYYLFDKVDENGSETYKIATEDFNLEEKYYIYNKDSKVYSIIKLTDDDNKVY